MSVVFVLIGASLLVAIGFLVAYLWAVKSGQYDDKYTPSIRILFDDNNKVQNDLTTKQNSKSREQSAENKVLSEKE